MNLRKDRKMKKIIRLLAVTLAALAVLFAVPEFNPEANADYIIYVQDGQGWTDYYVLGDDIWYSYGPTISNEGYRLAYPSSWNVFTTPVVAEVFAIKSRNCIYLKPTTSNNAGNLGTVRHGDTVLLLAEQNGYFFFRTRDGRLGWNETKYFVF